MWIMSKNIRSVKLLPSIRFGDKLTPSRPLGIELLRTFRHMILMPLFPPIFQGLLNPSHWEGTLEQTLELTRGTINPL